MPEEVVDIFTGAATESILLAAILVIVTGIVLYVRIMRPLWEKKLDLEAERERSTRDLERERVAADRAMVASIDRLAKKLENDQTQQLQTQQYLQLLLGSIQTLNETITQSREQDRENWKGISDRMTSITTGHLQKLDTVLKKQTVIQNNHDQIQDFLKKMDDQMATLIIQTGDISFIKDQLKSIKISVDVWVQTTAEKMKKFEEMLHDS